MSDIKTLVEQAAVQFSRMNKLKPSYLILHQLDWPAFLTCYVGNPVFRSVSNIHTYDGAVIVKTYDNYFRNNPKFVTE